MEAHACGGEGCFCPLQMAERHRRIPLQTGQARAQRGRHAVRPGHVFALDALDSLANDARQRAAPLGLARRQEKRSATTQKPNVDANELRSEQQRRFELRPARFHALECYRVSHWLWQEGRKAMALFLQSRISQLFAVDVHPAAEIGRGIMFDHATGIVIGETAVVEDDVSIMQDVTLGGTGKESGDRHPKIRRGVLLSLGAKILGNIEVGEYSRVGAGSVVLKPIPAHCTAVGVPAKLVNCDCGENPSQAMDHYIEELPDNTG